MHLPIANKIITLYEWMGIEKKTNKQTSTYWSSLFHFDGPIIENAFNNKSTSVCIESLLFNFAGVCSLRTLEYFKVFQYCVPVMVNVLLLGHFGCLMPGGTFLSHLVLFALSLNNVMIFLLFWWIFVHEFVQNSFYATFHSRSGKKCLLIKIC